MCRKKKNEARYEQERNYGPVYDQDQCFPVYGPLGSSSSDIIQLPPIIQPVIMMPFGAPFQNLQPQQPAVAPAVVNDDDDFDDFDDDDF